MGKGILMERDGGKAVVLTPQGEFKRVSVPRGTWDIGDEIEYADARPAAPWARWGLVAAAAAVFAMAPIGYQSWALAQPVAVVTIDINPSVQLLVNKRDQVLKVQALNADGELVLDGIDWKRQPVSDVVASVTAKAVEIGKLDPTSETGAVVVAVAPVKDQMLPDEVADRVSAEIKTSVDTTMKTEADEKGKEKKAVSAVLEANQDEVEAAKDVGLTPGRLFILEQVQEKAPDVKPEDIANKGPGQLLKDLGINPSEVFSKSEEKHGSQNKKNDDKGKGNDKDKTGQSDDRPTLGTGGQDDDKGKGNDKDKDKNNGNGNGNGNGRDNPAGPAAPSADKDKPSGSNSGGQTPPGQQKKDEPKGNSGNDDKESGIPRAILPGVGASVEVKPAPDAKGNGNGKGSDKGESGSDDKGNGKGKSQSDDQDDEKSKPGNGKDKGNGGR